VPVTGDFYGRFELIPSTTPWWASTRYEFRLDPYTPLTWNKGTLHAQPDAHFISDGGTIPRLVQVIPALQKDRYWRSYGFHDSGYRYGGQYERDGWIFRFNRRSRAFLDNQLFEQLIAEGATLATARTVWLFVRAFGIVKAWSARRQAECRKADGVVG
jgi:hypothetical protein